jgi:hypothetical protein
MIARSSQSKRAGWFGLPQHSQRHAVIRCQIRLPSGDRGKGNPPIEQWSAPMKGLTKHTSWRAPLPALPLTTPVSVQQRLVKTGGRLVKHARYYWLLLAESHLTRSLFGAMLRRIWALPVLTG